jgi:hypothetical protein
MCEGLLLLARTIMYFGVKPWEYTRSHPLLRCCMGLWQSLTERARMGACELEHCVLPVA